LVPIESLYVTSYLFLILTNILSRTVPKLLQIIDQICAFNRGVLLFNTHTHPFGVNLKTQEHKIWPQKTKNIALLCRAKCVSISWTISVWITSMKDRQTQSLLAIAWSNDPCLKTLWHNKPFVHIQYLLCTQCAYQASAWDKISEKYAKIYKSNKGWTKVGNTRTILQYNSRRMYMVYPS